MAYPLASTHWPAADGKPLCAVGRRARDPLIAHNAGEFKDARIACGACTLILRRRGELVDTKTLNQAIGCWTTNPNYNGLEQIARLITESARECRKRTYDGDCTIAH